MINNYFLYILLGIVNHPCAKEMLFCDENTDYMYNLVDNNSIEDLEILLEQDPTYAKRLFFYSLFHEKSEIAFFMLEYIKNVNEKFFLNNCFLQASTQFNDLKITHKLLKMGADPNPDGQHPLINAIWNNNNEIFDLLITYGSDITVTYPFVNRLDNKTFNKILENITIENLYQVNYYNRDSEKKKIIEKQKNQYLEPISKRLKNEDILQHIETFISIS